MAGILGLLMSGAGLIKDQYFNLTTLLLPGNGTNGAQNNTFLDGSTNNFTITRNGNTTQGTFSPFSQTGWSNYFAGGGNYLTVADSTAFDLPGDFTIEFEVYPLTRNNALFGLGDYRTANNGMSLYYDSGTNALRLYSNGADVLIGVSAVPLNQWSHIAIVRSGTSTNNLKLYINGQFDTQGTTNASFTGVAGNGVSINVDYGGLYPGTGPTDYISNVRIVKGQALTSGNFTPPTAPLTTTSVGWSGANAASSLTGTISLLICQANRFRDAGNGFTVTPIGSPSVVAFSPFAPTAAYTTAAVGGSGYFDGSGDYLSIADNVNLEFGSSTITLECWFYMAGSTGYLLDKNNSGSGGEPGFSLYVSTTQIIWYYDSSNNGYVISPISITITQNSWHHIALVRSVSGSTTNSVFLDGLRVGTSSTSTAFPDNSQPFRIGVTFLNGSVYAPFTGYISNVRLVKGTAVYDPTQTNLTVPTSPPTAITNTSLLLNYTNAGITDATAKNDLETVGNAQISTTQSKWGGSSISFDGTGDWLLIPDQPQQRIGTGNFTIEMWVYRNASGTYGLVGKGTGTTGWLVSLNSSNQVVFSYGSSTITSTGTVPATTWTYIAVVREGTGTNQTKIYINGTNDGTGTVSTDFNQTNSMYIGADRTGGSAANAYVQDVRITNYARTITASPTAPFPKQ